MPVSLGSLGLAPISPAFPGPWIGGTSLVLGPLLMITGVLLRIQFHFFFPQQLAAYAQEPRLIAVAYSFFAAGIIALWPGLVVLAQEISANGRPGWAAWGGGLAVFGLFARTFHAGVDHLAFQAVHFEGVDRSVKLVSSSYGSFHLASALNGAIVFGWIVLAIGCYRSSTLGLFRSSCLGLMAGLMLGVLKGSSWMSVAATTGLCVALVPLGMEMLWTAAGSRPERIAIWALCSAVFVGVMFYTGQLG